MAPTGDKYVGEREASVSQEHKLINPPCVIALRSTPLTTAASLIMLLHLSRQIYRPPRVLRRVFFISSTPNVPCVVVMVVVTTVMVESCGCGCHWMCWWQWHWLW